MAMLLAELVETVEARTRDISAEERLLARERSDAEREGELLDDERSRLEREWKRIEEEERAVAERDASVAGMVAERGALAASEKAATEPDSEELAVIREQIAELDSEIARQQTNLATLVARLDEVRAAYKRDLGKLERDETVAAEVEAGFAESEAKIAFLRSLNDRDRAEIMRLEALLPNWREVLAELQVSNATSQSPWHSPVPRASPARAPTVQVAPAEVVHATTTPAPVPAPALTSDPSAAILSAQEVMARIKNRLAGRGGAQVDAHDESGLAELSAFGGDRNGSMATISTVSRAPSAGVDESRGDWPSYAASFMRGPRSPEQGSSQAKPGSPLRSRLMAELDELEASITHEASLLAGVSRTSRMKPLLLNRPRRSRRESGTGSPPRSPSAMRRRGSASGSPPRSPSAMRRRGSASGSPPRSPSGRIVDRSRLVRREVFTPPRRANQSGIGALASLNVSERSKVVTTAAGDEIQTLVSPGAKRKGAGTQSQLSYMPSPGRGAPTALAYDALLEPATLNEPMWHSPVARPNGPAPGVLYSRTKKQLAMLDELDVDAVYKRQLAHERELRAAHRAQLATVAQQRVDADVAYIRAAVATGGEVPAIIDRRRAAHARSFSTTRVDASSLDLALSPVASAKHSRALGVGRPWDESELPASLAVAEWERDQKALIDAATATLVRQLEAETETTVSLAKHEAIGAEARAMEARAEELQTLAELSLESQLAYVEVEVERADALLLDVAGDAVLLQEPSTAARVARAARRRLRGHAGLSVASAEDAAEDDDDDDVTDITALVAAARHRLESRRAWLWRRRLVVLLQLGAAAAEREYAAGGMVAPGSRSAASYREQVAAELAEAQVSLDADFAELASDGEAGRLPLSPMPLVATATGRVVPTHKDEASLDAGVAPPVPAWRTSDVDDHGDGDGDGDRVRKRVRKRIRKRPRPVLGLMHDPKSTGAESMVVRSRDDASGEYVQTLTKRKPNDPDGVVCLRLGKSRTLRLVLGLRNPSEAGPLLRSLDKLSVSVPGSGDVELEVLQKTVRADGTELVATIKWPEPLDAGLGWHKPCEAGERRPIDVDALVSLNDAARSQVRVSMSLVCKLYGAASKVQKSKSRLAEGPMIAFERVIRVAPRVGVYIVDMGFDVDGALVVARLATREKRHK
ncbi:uncharacterized protein AMSG_06798 [Thecamonas trahens ATCC 50062]|uniref:Uncharacterized protein n=1 Tax=Thecamonas trahens ATCC 50062 TaxID=461836 RepID=A0A0L0DDU7_THETB|nr:hypothetical protein AMSG_06798 [Thecamonas trahens ATCC 50062]KNC50316.1 hypothetical protein AMSG_06798 [Thecamonas trahens ATCC 50062]|eukprot:XP_013756862.1 hypothetical protein AMSG_06798 [Thecamonas trahens ATCC 50062]